MAAAPAPLIAVVGPTGAGKSALAMRLARAMGGEIVSCDSRQVYRGLDIGTAKATAAEREEVRHHLVDVVDLDQDFSAADYARAARGALRAVAERGRIAIVVGGTGLYLKALLEGLFEGPARDPKLRRRLEAIAEWGGNARLHRWLGRVDRAAASRIDPGDRVRIVRALEVFRLSGRPISELRRDGADPLVGFSVLTLGLAPERAALRVALQRRTDEMIAAGLREEVRSLLARGYASHLRPLRAIGYRQMAAVVEGRMDPEAARAEITLESMRYAKRQMTWFRRQPGVRWFSSADNAFDAGMRWAEPPDPGRPEPSDSLTSVGNPSKIRGL